jgi:hypothetical protein
VRGLRDVRFASLADKPSLTKIRRCPLSSKTDNAGELKLQPHKTFSRGDPFRFHEIAAGLK